ncbi:hypothetical protein TL16_g09027 [Triparma laevis f. inornata]|uniref:Uncharacterized protein n=1 Tax=Triparma laevis f. inornata TaxID=1714386 RepID=A0A9W7ELR5_9STRA|nr:hypothetical protein TL16_g09027 [Triparma laevis f. inornata]
MASTSNSRSSKSVITHSPSNNPNDGLPPPPSPLTPSLQSSTPSDILRYSSKILSLNVKDINTHKLKGVLEICQSIIRELTSDDYKDRSNRSSSSSRSSSREKNNNNERNAEVEDLKRKLSQTKASLRSSQEELSRATSKLERTKVKNGNLKSEVVRLNGLLEEAEAAKLAKPKMKNHRTQTIASDFVEVEEEEEEEEENEDMSQKSRRERFKKESKRLNDLHRQTRLPSPLKPPSEAPGSFNRHDDMKLIESVIKVQKCWRGVLNKRVWTDMLEKMMDQEVDLSGIDLSSSRT